MHTIRFFIDFDLPASAKVRGNYNVKHSPSKNSDEMSLGEEQNSKPYCESPEYPTAAINTLITGHILRQLINHINEVAIYKKFQFNFYLNVMNFGHCGNIAQTIFLEY